MSEGILHISDQLETFIQLGKKEYSELRNEMKVLQNQFIEVSQKLDDKTKAIKVSRCDSTLDTISEEKDKSISQLQATLQIVSHMSKQAMDMTRQERQSYQKRIEELELQVSKYEIEIAKKYAIIN